MKKLLTVYLGLCLTFACKEKETEMPLLVSNIEEAEVVILNEGNFQWGNASLSLYNPVQKSIEHDIFLRNNQQTPLGDVVQSMVFLNQQAFVVVNNSSKIRVLNPTTFQQIGEIKSLNSPRYILPISANKAYVSDLYEDKLYVIDPTNFSISKTIETKGWTEEMVLVDHKAFVCQVDSNQLWVFDIRTDSLLQKISTLSSPMHLEVDQNQHVWVSCSGGLQNDLAALQMIDPNTLSIHKSMAQTNPADFIGEIELNANRDELYYLNQDGLAKIHIEDSILASSAFIPLANRTFYGFSMHPQNDEIYLSDALDYLQNGRIYRYSVAGNLLDEFNAGIIPGDIVFK